MRISRLLITVFAVILFVFAMVSVRVSANSSTATSLNSQSKSSVTLVADGSDPLPKPWHKLVA